MLSYGIIWCQKRRVEVDYTKWLGPDWKFDPKTSYEGAGTYVANHQSFADILIQLWLHYPAPGYVAREVVKRVWGVGYVAEVILQSLFVSRTDARNKHDVLYQI